ncbi:DedA family protein [Agarivorans sp. TSD2052]|uniref:DedA family protein n=1 Tax=Agarivorans sp. TSD2052 TaxID=2937286 RepID=UPI00200F3516|nr:DedA family protein [Agarivorans sp. TSD2052]UPW17486.1 DedA family protein [Agarivorans sp. TSD2052]
MLELLSMIYNSDFESLRDISSTNWLLFLLFMILFIESSFVFLPLPGDSLVLFAGTLIGLGILDFTSTFALLSLGAGLGTCIAYLQGRYLQKTKLMSHAKRAVPSDTMQRANTLLRRFGFIALLVSRFIPFVRVVTPMLMGAAEFKSSKTVLMSLTSALMWVCLLLLVGKWITINPLVYAYQHLLTRIFILSSLVLMLVAIVGILYRLSSRGKRIKSL